MASNLFKTRRQRQLVWPQKILIASIRKTKRKLKKGQYLAQKYFQKPTDGPSSTKIFTK